jgi:hypothetical protein
MRILEDDEWKAKSDREIARICSVSYFLSTKIRAELSDIKCQIEQRQVTRNGKTYTMSTANIGQ